MKSHNLNKKILVFTKEQRAVTTSEVAKEFKLSWNTAEKYLTELFIENKLLRLKKEGVNIWMLK